MADTTEHLYEFMDMVQGFSNSPTIMDNAARNVLKLHLAKLISIQEKEAYNRGYNSGYAGAKRGRSKKGDNALRVMIESIVDERLEILKKGTVKDNE